MFRVISDGLAIKAAYRVACTQLKNPNIMFESTKAHLRHAYWARSVLPSTVAGALDEQTDSQTECHEYQKFEYHEFQKFFLDP